MNDGLSAHTPRFPCILCSYTQRAPPSHSSFAHCLQESYFCSVRSLPLRQGIRHRERMHGMQARQWGEVLPIFVFPEIILVWEQCHRLQQPLARTHNSAHCLPARGEASLYCSTVQSLANSDSPFLSLRDQ